MLDKKRTKTERLRGRIASLGSETEDWPDAEATADYRASAEALIAESVVQKTADAIPVQRVGLTEHSLYVECESERFRLPRSAIRGVKSNGKNSVLMLESGAQLEVSSALGALLPNLKEKPEVFAWVDGRQRMLAWLLVALGLGMTISVLFKLGPRLLSFLPSLIVALPATLMILEAKWSSEVDRLGITVVRGALGRRPRFLAQPCIERLVLSTAHLSGTTQPGYLLKAVFRDVDGHLQEFEACKWHHRVQALIDAKRVATMLDVELVSEIAGVSI